MKFELRFDLWFVLWLVVFASMCVLLMIRLIEYQHMQNDFEMYKDSLSPYIWEYTCDGGFDSKFYNCARNESFRNISGTFCNGIQLCETSYRSKQ